MPEVNVAAYSAGDYSGISGYVASQIPSNITDTAGSSAAYS